MCRGGVMNNIKHCVKVIFEESQYNYVTSFNGSYQEAQDYFLNVLINVGNTEDKWLRCVAIIYQ